MDVMHDASHRAEELFLVFVVHSNADHHSGGVYLMEPA